MVNRKSIVTLVIIANYGNNVNMAAFVTKTMVTLLTRVHVVMKTSRSTCEVPATLIGLTKTEFP
jgi:hypothetical protein